VRWRKQAAELARARAIFPPCGRCGDEICTTDRPPCDAACPNRRVCCELGGSAPADEPRVASRFKGAGWEGERGMGGVRGARGANKAEKTETREERQETP